MKNPVVSNLKCNTRAGYTTKIGHEEQVGKKFAKT